MTLRLCIPKIFRSYVRSTAFVWCIFAMIEARPSSYVSIAMHFVGYAIVALDGFVMEKVLAPSCEILPRFCRSPVMTNLNNHFQHSSLALYYRSPFRWYSTNVTVVTSIDQRYMQRSDSIRFDVFLSESFRLHALDAFRRQNPTSRTLRQVTYH